MRRLIAIANAKAGRVLATALLGAAAATWFACNSILGIDPPTLVETPPADTGMEAEAATDTGPACDPAHWPEAPSVDVPGDGGTGDVDFLVALRTLDVSESATLGWDLDQSCTCPAPDSCRRPKDAGQACDEPNGRDIQLNKTIISLLEFAPGFSPSQLGDGIAKGHYGVLVRVQNYNGGPDDRAVTVSIYLSTGSAGLMAPTDGGAWDLDPNTLDPSVGDAGTPVSKYIDDTAWVRGGMLVASKLQGAKVHLVSGSQSLDFELTQGALTAKIAPRDGNRWALEDGTLAGRWPTKNALKAISVLTDPASGKPFCEPGSTFYPIVKSELCGNADVSSNIARDNSNADCDALSLAMRFTAEPAQFGVVRAAVLDGGPNCMGFNDDCTK